MKFLYFFFNPRHEFFLFPLPLFKTCTYQQANHKTLHAKSFSIKFHTGHDMPAQIKCRSKPRGLTHGFQEQTTILLSRWLRKAFCIHWILPCVGIWLCYSWRWGGTALGGHSCFATCPLPHRGSAWEVPGLVPRPAGACTHLFSTHHPSTAPFNPTTTPGAHTLQSAPKGRHSQVPEFCSPFAAHQEPRPPPWPVFPLTSTCERQPGALPY